MRLSPVVMAAFALTATLGLSRSAVAKTPNQPTQPQAKLTPRSGSPVPKASTTAAKIPPAQAGNVVVETIPVLQTRTAAKLPALSEIKQVAQGTIEQETPNQIQLNPSAPVPTSPNIPTIPNPGTAPTVPPGSPQAPTPTPEGQQTPPETPQAPPETPQAPTETQPLQPAQPAQPTQPTPAPDEPRVLVSEVLVTGVEGELQNEVYRVIQTQAGRTTTRTQLQNDINAIFATGFFSNVRATPEDTPLGVRVTFEVAANPVLRSVQIPNTKVLQQADVDRIFGPQYGRITNFRDLQTGIQELTKFYQDRGFVLAQVVNAQQPQVNADGTVVLDVTEGEIERIQVRFINKEGQPQDAQGRPIRGRTRDFIVTRELQSQPGTIVNRNTIQRDFERLFGLGLFDEGTRPNFDVGQDPRKVVLFVDVVERNTGNIGLAGGFSSASGLFGSVSYGQQNFGGNNQRLNAEVQIGQRDQQFELSFTDPWIGGDPFRTSYTLSVFRRRTISLVFDGGDPEVRLGNADRDRPRINRTGGGISFSRPLSRNVFERAEWVASLGLQYQRVNATDGDGIRRRVDELGNPLTFDPSGNDDLFTGQLALRRDRRDDFFRPTRGSVLQFSTEQSVPIGSGSILYNRVRGSYSFYIPTRLTRFTPECRERDPRRVDLQQTPQGRCAQAFAFNVQAGSVFGDLPPYEAFPLGGTNSVRGYDEGEVGSGRSFLQATAEYRFPIFSIVSGALFFDAATDLGSGDRVPGNPAGVRGKPGSGFGYGIGIRVQAGPLGPIRIDYGINDQGGSNIRFGFGERF
ncbi:BamA/TamA family outer membrane protein [Leptolyngbya sp. AN03gr2]|uniref:BamA/TamA family outer membrane protein n=1 Tax=unclassified Leptolyngbya TaxID=2650499 RepID=UPI003D324187